MKRAHMAHVGRRALVLTVDVGTTGVRALLIDETGAVAAQAYRETLPRCPAPGLVEHDREELLAALLGVIRTVVDSAEARDGRVHALGLTTQRATAVAWETRSGRPLGPALSWQDVR